MSHVLRIAIAVIEWLLSRASGHRSNLPRIIAWWEARRIPYNMILGIVSVVSAAVTVTVSGTCQRLGGASLGLPDPSNPALFAVVAAILFALAANLCYTGGWILEVAVVKLWRVDTLHFGPIAFALGTALFVLITLFPAAAVVTVATVTSCQGFGW